MVIVLAIAAQLAAAPAPPRPREPLPSYISSNDFPVGVVRSAARPVAVILTVGPDGRVTQCLVTASGGSAALDSTTCRLLRSRARFSPALDAAGVPVSGELTATIDWPALAVGTPRTSQARQPQGITLAPWESISRLRVRLGQVGECHWSNTGPVPPPPSSNACQNGDLARMALGIAAENQVNLNTAQIVVTMRMTGAGFVEPSPATPAALVDLAAQLDVAADGQLTGCRFLREQVRTSAPSRLDCRTLFRGPYIPATNSAGNPIATNPRIELKVEAR